MEAEDKPFLGNGEHNKYIQSHCRATLGEGHTQTGDLISHNLCFQNKENMLKVSLLISLWLSLRLLACKNSGIAILIIMKLNIQTFFQHLQVNYG
jgi:hypothetical protein